ncbi:hypothetical protein CN581_22700 [Bacillus toyonensis]|nr:hypothetical protein CN581_22700 [Bacillus toyonensis]
MLDKLKNHFKEVDLVCSQCNKTIEHGEKFAVSLVLTEKNMPVRQLDKILANRANEILWSTVDGTEILPQFLNTL